MNRHPFLYTLAMLTLAATSPAAAETTLTFQWGSAETALGFYRGDDAVEGQESPIGPASFAVDAEGNLFIADTFNRRIKKFSIAGRLLEAYGGDAPPFGYIADVRVAPDGSLLFLDEENQQVVRLAGGAPIQKFGGAGEGPGLFLQARLLGVAGDGTVVVGDMGKNELLLFDNLGKYLRSFPWNDNGFHVTPAGTLLELDYDEKKGYTLVERDLAKGRPKTRFEVGLPDRVRAAVVGADDEGRVTLSFSTLGTDAVEFSTWSREGKRLHDFTAPRSTEIRQASVMGIGRIFCLIADPAAAPAGDLKIVIR